MRNWGWIWCQTAYTHTLIHAYTPSRSYNMNAKPTKSGIPVWIYGLVGILLLVIGYRLMAPSTAEGAHPDPRAGITSAKVLPASQFVEQPDVARVYAEAKEIPEVLDGIYCHCQCHKFHGHRSLLT